MMVNDDIRQKLYGIFVSVVYGIFCNEQDSVHKGILPIDYDRCYDIIEDTLSDLFTSQFDDEVYIWASGGAISVHISGHMVTTRIDCKYINSSVVILILLLSGFNPTKIHYVNEGNEEFNVVNVTMSLELFAKLSVRHCIKLISRINQNYVIDRQVIIDTINNLSDDDIEKQLYFLRYLFDNYDFPQKMEKLEL